MTNGAIGEPRRLPGPWRRRSRLAVAGLLVLSGVFAAGTWTGWLLALERDAAAEDPEVLTVARGPAGTGRAAVPDVRGLAVADATQVLVDGGADPRAVTVVEQPSALAAGTVVAQDPVGGATLDGPVRLVVAAPATVPDVLGRPAAEVVADLEATGARVAVEERYDPGAAVGSVLEVVPAAGQPLVAEVRLVVAGAAASVFLDQVDAVAGGCSRGALQIDGAEFSHGLRCAARGDGASAEFLLDRGVGRLAGTVGVPDDAEPGATARLVLLGDGRELARVDLAYGRGAPVDVVTAGVLRLAIRVEGTDGARSVAALGDVVLYGGRDAIDRLDR